MDDFTAKWVKPYYLAILHANYVNFISEEEREVFNQDAVFALAEIDDSVVADLLNRHWREQLTGSWFCGVKGWKRFGPQLGELLVASKSCFAGQGYCFALASFANENSAMYLVKYLDKYLPQLDFYYDQGWAMAALMWVDNKLETAHSRRFLEPNGLWERFVADKIRVSGTWQIETNQRELWNAMEYCQAHFMSS